MEKKARREIGETRRRKGSRMKVRRGGKLGESVRLERREGDQAAAPARAGRTTVDGCVLGRVSSERCSGLAGPENSVAKLILMSFLFLNIFYLTIKPLMYLLRIWLGMGTYMFISIFRR